MWLTGEVRNEGGKGEKRLDLGKGLEAGKDLEFGEGNGDFGLVIWIRELIRVFFVQLGCELFVWVELERESLCYGEDLERVVSTPRGIPLENCCCSSSRLITHLRKEGQLSVVLLDNLLAQ